MKKITSILCSIALIAMCAGWSGCNATLEKGGAYNPVVTNAVTNVDGQVTFEVVPVAAPQKILFIADESYKFAYTTTLDVLRIEKEDRAEIAAILPGLKASFDKVRTEVRNIDLRWAKAREAYQKNPTPAGLDAIHSLLLEVQRILPILQTELAPYIASRTKSKTQ